MADVLNPDCFSICIFPSAGLRIVWYVEIQGVCLYNMDNHVFCKLNVADKPAFLSVLPYCWNCYFPVYSNVNVCFERKCALPVDFFDVFLIVLRIF